MTTPGELVTAFCAEWRTGTPESIVEYFTDDAVYHNIPMQPLTGKPAILEFLRGFIGGFGNIDFDIHHQAETGTTVLNERTDRFTIGENKIELPVMGSFEIRDGKIAAWRDYFDMAPLNALGGN
ncbi:limonene-1,2-epoxide hydrolase family protein [Nocardia miyunensis]|uniref:limonene-1,2-epoxide hydrolase family protein n=1 Tax=Nocardia miyunensis TaxID=282684 RepID=UPI0008374DBE|nr:limonene-1,2-epoxide hydrolase family protein [Nocardia miyunensis]